MLISHPLYYLKSLLQAAQQGLSVCGEVSDTLCQLLGSHSVLVQGESEGRFVVDVADLWIGGVLCVGNVQLLWYGLAGVHQLFQQLWCNSQVVATSQFLDFTDVSERSAHDNGLVVVFLVVVVDLLDGYHTRVGFAGVGFTGSGLVPVHDSTDKRRDQGDLGLGTGNSLREREQQGQVTVNTVFGFQFLGGLNTFPGGSNLNQDSVLGNTNRFVQLDDFQGLGDGGLLVEGQLSINLGRHSSWHNAQDLLTELNQ